MFLHVFGLIGFAQAISCSEDSPNQTECDAITGMVCEYNTDEGRCESCAQYSMDESSCNAMTSMSCQYNDNACRSYPQCGIDFSWPSMIEQACGGNCTAMFNWEFREKYLSCGIFCQSMGQECVSGFYDTEDDPHGMCSFNTTVSCDFNMKSMEEIRPICECGSAHTLSAPQGCPNPPWNWTDSAAVCPDQDCKVFVKVNEGDSSCDEYCTKQGLHCMRAFSSVNGCFGVGFERGCGMKSSELLCECGTECAASAAECGRDAKESFRDLEGVSICSQEVQRILTNGNKCIGELLADGCSENSITQELLDYKQFAEELSTIGCHNGVPSICKDMDSAIMFVTSRTALANITMCEQILSIADCDVTVGNTGFQVRDGCCASCENIAEQCTDSGGLVEIMMGETFLRDSVYDCTTAIDAAGCDTLIGGMYSARDACCVSCENVDPTVLTDYNPLIADFVGSSTETCTSVGSVYGCEMCHEGFCLWQACASSCEPEALKTCMCPNGLFGGDYEPFEAAKSQILEEMYDTMALGVKWCAWNASSYTQGGQIFPTSGWDGYFKSIIENECDGEYHEGEYHLDDVQYQWAWWSPYDKRVFYDDGNGGIYWGDQTTDFDAWCEAQDTTGPGKMKDMGFHCVTINGIAMIKNECNADLQSIISKVAPHCCHEQVQYSCYIDCMSDCQDQYDSSTPEYCTCYGQCDFSDCNPTSRQKLATYVALDCNDTVNWLTMTTTTGATPEERCTREADCNYAGAAYGFTGSCSCECDFGYTGTYCSDKVTVVSEVSLTGMTLTEFADNAATIKDGFAASIGKPSYMVQIVSVSESSRRRRLNTGLNVVFEVLCESVTEVTEVQTAVEAPTFTDNFVADISTNAGLTVTADAEIKTACAPTECVHGYTTDYDDSDGCDCTCDEGYSGADCSVDDSIPTTTTPTTTTQADGASNMGIFAGLFLVSLVVF